jgi:hypothetical protein
MRSVWLAHLIIFNLIVLLVLSAEPSHTARSAQLSPVTSVRMQYIPALVARRPQLLLCLHFLKSYQEMVLCLTLLTSSLITDSGNYGLSTFWINQFSPRSTVLTEDLVATKLFFTTYIILSYTLCSSNAILIFGFRLIFCSHFSSPSLSRFYLHFLQESVSSVSNVAGFSDHNLLLLREF